ncbi:MAG: glycine--tRNA ligase subunit beta [Alphaproteobacteria bacterium]|nr:glycine--tRNA ligase subunit beta [Alphaproteobacteria bacterium]
MAQLLLELFSEEIPARMQARASDELKRLVTEGLAEAGLAFESANTYATPRRLALCVEGVPERQPDIRDERKGPKVGAPDKAIEGFLRGAGLESLDQCEKRETPKGAVWFAVIEKPGRDTQGVLPDILTAAIRKLVWPKSMRWAGNSFRWVRPLHSILAAFAGAALEGELDLGGGTVRFGNHTYGHRFLHPGYIAATNFEEYSDGLRSPGHVVLDQAERREIIADGLAKLAKKAKLTVRDDPALLDEVTGLVEWPVVLIGGIDTDFMDLPPEVLTTAMRSHQKYFTLLKADGSMAPHFALVANIETADGGAQIVAGNERVLRARLADARFFWDQDRKQTLASRTTALGGITFHAKLGSLDAKVDRVQALAAEIAKYIDGADRDRVRAAARLAKADLVTGMVGEFPELQGLMGRYYALADGEHADVADAIRDHYAPQGPNDACPSAPVSVAVALADKIDTLAGFWAIDEKPTGSKDPYALRRAALGVIRLIVENGLRLGLLPAFGSGFGNFGAAVTGGAEKSAVCDDLLSFFADRLKVHLRGQGVRHDLIAAVFALGGEDDLVRLLARVGALQDFIASDDGANLLTAYRRAANILKIEEKKDGVSYDEAPDAGGYVQDQEAALGRALDGAAKAVEAAVTEEKFTGAMAALAALRSPVDAYFDKVTVNTDDSALRANRLRLLSRIRATMGLLADFSQIEG